MIVCLLVVLAGGAAAWDCAVWTSEYAPTAWTIRSYVHWLDEPTAQVYAADRAIIGGFDVNGWGPDYPFLSIFGPETGGNPVRELQAQLALAVFPEAIVLAGDAAYVAAGPGGILVVDLANLAAPVLVATLPTNGSCRDIAWDAERDVLVSAEWDSIRTWSTANRTAPERIGALRVGQAMAVELRDETAFVANGTLGLAVLDLTLPEAPTLLGQAPAGGNAYDVALWGDQALLASPTAGLVRIDITDPALPTWRSVSPLSGEGVQVLVHGDFAYVLSARVEPFGVDYLDDVQLFQLAEGRRPVLLATVLHAPLQKLAKAGDFLAVAKGADVLGLPWRCPIVVPVPDQPASGGLDQPFPNPFNPAATFRFALPAGHRGRVEICDARGRRITTLWRGEGDARPHEATWRGTDAQGRAVASGTYVFVLRDETDGTTRTRRASLLK
ncbi:hypothetical protein KDM41_00725 [bacterium]|nr:hypothetical protein [bacterium]